MLTKKQRILKRIFDVIVSFFGLVFLVIPIVLLIILSSIANRKFGLFTQQRVGLKGKLFTIYKIRTLREIKSSQYPELVKLDEFGISMKEDQRITFIGRFLRKNKLDELPQLFNVLIGDMSMVGPRPDIQGYADKLIGENRVTLSVKPGITGPATLAFRDEELLLFYSEDPISYNKEVIWPQKVKLNVEYIYGWSFKKDIMYIFQTIFN